MSLTANDIYKAVSDLISDSYEWLSDRDNNDRAVQYVLGINDMARFLIEKIDGDESRGTTYNSGCGFVD